MVEELKNWYDKNYKRLLFIPAILLIFSIFYLYNFTQQNGDIFLKDVSLTGGTTITVLDGSVDINSLKSELSSQFPDLNVRSISDLRTGKQQAFFVESVSEAPILKQALENYLGYSLDSENSSIEFSGSTISQGFYSQLRLAILISFLFMGIVVFIIFRTPLPSLAVIVSAFGDILMTIVTVNLFGMSLSTGGIVALLMLIGYSVDTDILLTSRILRRKQEGINKRILGAFKTGITMTLTSIVAITVALIIIYSFSDVLRQIFTILLIGLGFDILNTWITNVSILKWYAEVKRIE